MAEGLQGHLVGRQPDGSPERNPVHRQRHRQLDRSVHLHRGHQAGVEQQAENSTDSCQVRDLKQSPTVTRSYFLVPLY